MAAIAVPRAAPLRALPSVDAVLRHPDVAGLSGVWDRTALVEVVRDEVARARRAVARNEVEAESSILGLVVAGVLHAAKELRRPSLRRVINATGVVLHTNLGRAPLSASAAEAVGRVSSGYSNVELDLTSGDRGSRHSHLEALVCQVTGGEAALAVNNNAAALLLVLTELARDKEVVISRGQAVEIGGGFRVPDVLRQSGARLVEVGTTNRTRVADYATAIGPETAALLHVHTSNFRLVGFTESPEVAALAELGRERGVAVIADQGSGCLLDTTRFGVPEQLREPTVQAAITGGADVVTFSADKLLGGPQAGIVVGRAALIARLRRHPLARALRLDKGTIAALAATLLHYRVGDAEHNVPVWRMIGAGEPELRRRARGLVRRLAAGGVVAVAQRAESAVGGGSLPGVTLPTWVAAIQPPPGMTVDRLAEALRAGDPPVVARVGDDRLLVDLRTLLPGEDAQVTRLIVQISEGIIGTARN